VASSAPEAGPYHFADQIFRTWRWSLWRVRWRPVFHGPLAFFISESPESPAYSKEFIIGSFRASLLFKKFGLLKASWQIFRKLDTEVFSVWVTVWESGEFLQRIPNLPYLNVADPCPQFPV